MSIHDYNEFAAAGGNLNTLSSHPSPPEDTGALEPSAEARRDPQQRSDALAIYLREVGRHQLLTRREEIELARRVRQGDQLAYDRMVCGNLRLVIRIARHYEGLGLALLDLISEGNLGLMHAVDLFDPEKGAKLSSYSSWWIKQSMRRALSGQGKTIRLPVNATDKIYRLRRAARKLENTFHREPTNEELAAEVGLCATRVSHLRAATMDPVSLDCPLDDNRDSSLLGDILPDENSVAPDTRLEMAEQTKALFGLVARLDSREASILRHYFALDGNKEMTLEMLGRKLGYTRERIRQVKAGALVKMREMLDDMDQVARPAKVGDTARLLHGPPRPKRTPKRHHGLPRSARSVRPVRLSEVNTPAFAAIVEHCSHLAPGIRAERVQVAPRTFAPSPTAS
jgi:RNA polymerase primary sigma factor